MSAGEPGKQAPVAPRLGDEQAEAHGKGRCGIKEACSALPCLASVVGARLAVQAGQEEETACAAAQGRALGKRVWTFAQAERLDDVRNCSSSARASVIVSGVLAEAATLGQTRRAAISREAKRLERVFEMGAVATGVGMQAPGL